MEFVRLNKGEGTVTMSYGAYKAVHHDSVMLHILLRTQVVPETARTLLLNDLMSYGSLGTGFMRCQSTMPDDEAFEFVYGLTPEESLKNVILEDKDNA